MVLGWVSSVGLTNHLQSSLEQFSRSTGNNCRICFHESPQSLNHLMLIVERRGMNIPPHFHHARSDFIFLLRGQVNIYEFQNSGLLSQCVELTPGQGHKSGKEVVHAVGIMSDDATYLESSEGPFLGSNDAIYLPWSQEWHENFVYAILTT